MSTFEYCLLGIGVMVLWVIAVAVILRFLGNARDEGEREVGCDWHSESTSSTIIVRKDVEGDR